jgi:hypothetical protein
MCSTTTAKPPVHFALAILEMGVSQTICLRLDSNHDPPDLSLPSSWDDKHEPLVPLSTFLLKVRSMDWGFGSVVEHLASLRARP